MIHYICDRCKHRSISLTKLATSSRSIFSRRRITPVDELEDDVDHLAELHQILEGIAESQTKMEIQVTRVITDDTIFVPSVIVSS